MIRTARTHDVANQAFQRQVQDLLASSARDRGRARDRRWPPSATTSISTACACKATAALSSVVHPSLGDFEPRGLWRPALPRGRHRDRAGALLPAVPGRRRSGRRRAAARDARGGEHRAHPAGPAIRRRRDDMARQLGTPQRRASQRGRAKRIFWNAVLGTRASFAAGASERRAPTCATRSAWCSPWSTAS